MFYSTEFLKEICREALRKKEVEKTSSTEKIKTESTVNTVSLRIKEKPSLKDLLLLLSIPETRENIFSFLSRKNVIMFYTAINLIYDDMFLELLPDINWGKSLDSYNKISLHTLSRIYREKDLNPSLKRKLSIAISTKRDFRSLERRRREIDDFVVILKPFSFLDRYRLRDFEVRHYMGLLSNVGCLDLTSFSLYRLYRTFERVSHFNFSDFLENFRYVKVGFTKNSWISYDNRCVKKLMEKYQGLMWVEEYSDENGEIFTVFRNSVPALAVNRNRRRF